VPNGGRDLLLSLCNGTSFFLVDKCNGAFKSTALLLNNTKGAIAAVGETNVFIVALDGAFKSTLRMIIDEPSIDNISPQRCTAHGLNFLIAGIVK
jgi:hypothetical protein